MEVQAFDGKIKMNKVEDKKYLGDIVSNKGSNIKNIKKKQYSNGECKKDSQYFN